jgi:hypothetical protein
MSGSRNDPIRRRRKERKNEVGLQEKMEWIKQNIEELEGREDIGREKDVVLQLCNKTMEISRILFHNYRILNVYK